MNTVLHYLDGEWVTEDKLLIPVSDLSVARGFGVFDYLRTYDNRPFRLQAHIERFYNSAHLIGLQSPVSKQELHHIVQVGLDNNPPGEYGVRMTLTGGSKGDFITVAKPSLIVGFYELHTPSAQQQETGVKVITVNQTRHMPNAKSLNYMAGVMAMQEAAKRDAVEAIYSDEFSGELFEGTTTNLFAVRDGVVITPAEEILEGVTRQVVLELCDRRAIPYKETTLRKSEINDYGEMFITSSSKEILPVVTIDNRHIGDGTVGPVTKKLMRAFKDIAALER